MTLKRPTKTPKKAVRPREKSDGDFESPQDKKLRRSQRSPKKVTSKSVRRSARIKDLENETENDSDVEVEDMSFTEEEESTVFSPSPMLPKKGKKKTPLKMRFNRFSLDEMKFACNKFFNFSFRHGDEANTDKSPLQRKDVR